MPPVPSRLRRSNYLSWFAHMGAVYLFHDLYGYLMEMSPDIAELIESFATPHAATERLDMIEVLHAHAVLVDPDEDEIEALWAYAPVKGRWNVWQRRGDRMTIWTAWGERPIQQVFLDADETAIWDAFDGNKRLIELRHHHDNAKIIGLARRLVHSDVQALKLSMMPGSASATRPRAAPPYLTSTMPYRSWQVGTPVPAPVALDAYHATGIEDARSQFDHVETTLSHLLRVPHPALHGKTYGEALVDAVVAKLPPRVRVLEVGAGLGYVARDVQARLRAAGKDVDYTIVELSPVLAAAQRERAGDAKVILGDVLKQDFTEHAFELILANEMVGDLPAKQLAHTEAPPPGIDVEGAPDPYWLQTGAIELVGKIARWLAPGGTAVVTEFGDANQWPRVSSHLDHPELSTHFGVLAQVAKAAGLDARVEFVIDVLDVDRDQKGLATTRSHFRALHALAADAGIDLAKIGYTPALLDAAIAGKLDLAEVGELRWDRIEDRLMGLVPHEFRALIATK